VSVGSLRTKNPPYDNNSRIPYFEGSLPTEANFFIFKYKNVIKMKNKPDPALLRTSYLSNEMKKMTQKSHEPIPFSIKLLNLK
jgi:hypothetical protein